MKIRSFVGGHDVIVYQGAVFDPAVRKYRGGIPAAVIPYAGRMLSAVMGKQTEDLMDFDDSQIPIRSMMEWKYVDPLPETEECDFALVSSMYVSACKSMGIDTSRLVTTGGTVIDKDGKTIGCVWLNRN